MYFLLIGIMSSKHSENIREAVESDIPAIQKIYNEHTNDITSVVSFEEKTPSIEELTMRWRYIKNDNLPFIVCEMEDVIAGYAYATKFRSRAAYRHTVEESVYVAQKYQGQGVGKALLLKIIDQCKYLNVRCIVGVLGTEQDNPVSVLLHRKIGFQNVGTLHDVGYKNGKWVDRLMMEYIIK